MGSTLNHSVAYVSQGAFINAQGNVNAKGDVSISYSVDSAVASKQADTISAMSHEIVDLTRELRAQADTSSRRKAAIQLAISALERRDWESAERELREVFEGQLRANLFSLATETAATLGRIDNLKSPLDLFGLSTELDVYASNHPRWNGLIAQAVDALAQGNYILAENQLSALVQKQLRGGDASGALRTASYIAQLNSLYDINPGENTSGYRETTSDANDEGPSVSTLTTEKLNSRSSDENVDRVLTIVTTGHTSDWNPLNARTYAAVLVSRLISERLYERKCWNAYGRIKAHATLCQSDQDASPIRSKVRIDLSQRQCGKEVGRHPLSIKDIAYTLREIERSPYSEYRSYGIQLVGKDVLEVKDRIATDIRTLLDFPVLRQSGERSDALHSTQIRVGDSSFLNHHTAGFYKVSEISPSGITLEARQPSDIGPQRIRIIELALSLDKLSLMDRPTHPDVILAVPQSYPYPASRYRSVFSEDLASFTYIGFNFAYPGFRNLNPPPQRALVANRKFRELFTRSIWASDVIRDKLGIRDNAYVAPGIFLGESFDLVGGGAFVDLGRSNFLSKRIKSFLRHQKLRTPLKFRMLLSPSINMYFSRAEIDALLKDIGAMWSPHGIHGLTITAVRKGTPRSFAEARKRGDYHLIFDDFLYGRNDRRIVSFVDPSMIGTENFLGIDVFSARQIDSWLDGRDGGLGGFRRAVSELFPVAVIGHFPRRDLIALDIERGEIDCGTGFPFPFFGLNQWEVSLRPN